MEDEAAKFWIEFEMETEEKVMSRCVGIWHAKGGAAEGIWGILILTDKSLRFRHLPSQNWLTSLFKPHTSSTPKAVPEIIVPLDGIKTLIEPKRKLLARIFGQAFPPFELFWRPMAAEAETGQASERSEIFAADPHEELLVRLRKLAPPATPSL